SAPCPVPIELPAFEFRAGSSAVPYWQSGPGSVVSPSFVSSLSPVCGFEVLITPKPQSNWLVFVQKLRTPGPIRIAGSTKPGLWQHSSPNGQFTFVLVDVHAGSVPPPQLSHPPWMSTHLPIAPHWMHTVCSHVGGLPAVTVKVVVAGADGEAVRRGIGGADLHGRRIGRSEAHRLVGPRDRLPRDDRRAQWEGRGGGRARAGGGRGRRRRGSRRRAPRRTAAACR